MKRLSSLNLLSLCTTALLAQAGSLDPEFGNAGIQELAPGTLHDVAYDLIALPDTTTLICGVAQHDGTNAMFLAHLLHDGSLDTGFGTSSGYTYFNFGEEAYAYALARSTDGSIYMAGLAYPTFSQATVVLAHTDANGIPDAGFGANGVVSTPVGTLDAEARGMAIQSDGKIVLGGSVVNTGNFARDILFMRYNADGTLDDSFNGDGVAIASAYAEEDLLNDIALLEDGSIVGAGYASVIGDMKTVLARVDANGDFVTDFGGDGVIVPGFGVTQDRAFGILAVGQRFLVTGSFMDDPNNEDIYLASFNDDGTLAGTFGNNGVTITDENASEVGLDIAMGTDGSYIVAGTTGQPGFGAPRDFFVARYTAEGIPDATFGNNGTTITSIDVDFDDANAVAVQPDGKIVAAGFTAGFTDQTDNDVAVVRYLVDGPNVIGSLAASETPVVVRQGDQFTIRSTTAIEQVQVLDMGGRILVDRRTGGANEATFSIAEADAAVYVVCIHQEDTVIPIRVMR